MAFSARHGPKTIPVLLPADGEASLLDTTTKFSLYTIRRHSATQKHLFLYPQGDRSGLRKPKKDKYQH